MPFDATQSCKARTLSVKKLKTSSLKDIQTVPKPLGLKWIAQDYLGNIIESLKILNLPNLSVAPSDLQLHPAISGPQRKASG